MKSRVVKEDLKEPPGPQLAECELNFGVAHIDASFKNTFVHVTEILGNETISRVTCGMKVSAGMLAAQDVAARCKEVGINALHIELRAIGGTGTKAPCPGAQSALAPSHRIFCKNGTRS